MLMITVIECPVSSLPAVIKTSLKTWVVSPDRPRYSSVDNISDRQG